MKDNYKKHKVVMLPTENAKDCVLFLGNKDSYINKGILQYYHCKKEQNL